MADERAGSLTGAETSRFLISANSELEVAAIRGRLADAGIPVLAQGALQDKGVQFASSSDIYVKDEALERANGVLAEGSDFSDDDLAALSQQAYEEATEPPERSDQ
jgi:Putative prokaryotic signal transducing protein